MSKFDKIRELNIKGLNTTGIMPEMQRKINEIINVLQDEEA